jgi:hypothetical protein
MLGVLQKIKLNIGSSAGKSDVRRKGRCVKGREGPGANILGGGKTVHVVFTYLYRSPLQKRMGACCPHHHSISQLIRGISFKGIDQ